MKLGGLVVVASNAGGAWTPIGDITTTMLYIGGQVGWWGVILMILVGCNEDFGMGKIGEETFGCDILVFFCFGIREF